MKMTKSTLLLVMLGLLSPAAVLAQEEAYVLEAMVVPVHTQPRQLHLSVGYSFGYSGYSLAGSYAFTRSLAVFASGSKNTSSNQGNDIWGSGSFIKRDQSGFTGGVGFLLPSKNEEKVFELLVGGGIFSVDNQRYFKAAKDEFEITQAEYGKLFVQVNAVSIRKHFEFGGLLRLPYNSYSNFQFTNVHRDSRVTQGFENVWSINLEPAFTGTVKWYKVKVNLHAGYSFLMGQGKSKLYSIDPRNGNRVYFEDDSFKPNLEGMIGAISLQYNFNLKHKAE